MQRKTVPAIDRLMTRVVATPGPLDSDCLIPAMATHPKTGYVAVAISGVRGGPKRLAHRLSYEHFVGPIFPGLEVDHLCRVRACVNHEHLEAVTPIENKRRSNAPSAVAVRTNTCARGHSLADAYKNGPHRSCRTCRELRRGAA